MANNTIKFPDFPQKGFLGKGDLGFLCFHIEDCDSDISYERIILLALC